MKSIYKTIESEAQDIVRARIRKGLHLLKPREKRVLEMRFGIKDGIIRTLKAIADKEGVTRQRIQQIEAAAYNKIVSAKKPGR